MLAQHPKVCNILLSSTNFPPLPHIHEKAKLRPSCFSVYFSRPEPPKAPGNILWLSFQNIPLGCVDILPAHPPSTTLAQSLVKSLLLSWPSLPLPPWPHPSLHLDHSPHYHLDQAAHPPLELPLWILICPIKAPGFSVNNEPPCGVLNHAFSSCRTGSKLGLTVSQRQLCLCNLCSVSRYLLSTLICLRVLNGYACVWAIVGCMIMWSITHFFPPPTLRTLIQINTCSIEILRPFLQTLCYTLP